MHREIEVKFLEIDKEALKTTLRELGAIDAGEDLLDETIWYDKEMKWRDVEHKFVRMRVRKDSASLSFKKRHSHDIGGVEEIEFKTHDIEMARLFLERLDLIPFRHQQKLRHTFSLDGVTVDIDTWPQIPTYVELEGESEEDLRSVAAKIGFSWSNARLESARQIIEKVYGIKMGDMKHFTFSKME